MFTSYPNLKEKLKHIELSDLPTPIFKLKQISDKFGLNLYMKCDNIGGKSIGNEQFKYGVNKLRKLEFILPDALSRGAKTIFTFGCVGSNHVVATAIYGKYLGFDVIALLKPQPNSRIVRKNLLLMYYNNVQMIYYPSHDSRKKGFEYELEKYQLKYNDVPYVIPTGGTCPLGTIGYVNAAFELKKQIDDGIIAEPDYIYVPIGSLGTCSGLILGIIAAGLKSKIISVAIEPEEYYKSFEIGIFKLFNETNKLLNSLDSSFKIFDLLENEIYVNHNFSGEDYGLFIHEAVNAIKFAQETEDVTFDGIYSGKAFAALISDIKNGLLKKDGSFLEYILLGKLYKYFIRY